MQFTIHYTISSDMKMMALNCHRVNRPTFSSAARAHHSSKAIFRSLSWVSVMYSFMCDFYETQPLDTVREDENRVANLFRWQMSQQNIVDFGEH